MCIYIYIERERERQREIDRYIHIYIYTYIYIWRDRVKLPKCHGAHTTQRAPHGNKVTPCTMCHTPYNLISCIRNRMSALRHVSYTTCLGPWTRRITTYYYTTPHRTAPHRTAPHRATPRPAPPRPATPRSAMPHHAIQSHNTTQHATTQGNGQREGFGGGVPLWSIFCFCTFDVMFIRSVPNLGPQQQGQAPPMSD